MLEDFGLYPVCLQIDLDSYEGDWRHVARFRNRTGWLLVAEAEIWVGDEHQATMPLIVGCDEWDEPIPSFIAANLLRCASSLPQLCDEFAPDALELLIERERGEVRKRWLRESNAAIAHIHEAGERAVRELEEGVDAQMRASDKLIADLSRRRRMLPLDHPGRTAFAEAIADQEDWQTGMISWLADRRQELRDHYEAQERRASRGLRPRLEVEPLYVVNWHHAEAPADDALEALSEAVTGTRPWPLVGHGKLELSDEQLAAMKDVFSTPRLPVVKKAPLPPVILDLQNSGEPLYPFCGTQRPEPEDDTADTPAADAAPGAIPDLGLSEPPALAEPVCVVADPQSSIASSPSPSPPKSPPPVALQNSPSLSAHRPAIEEMLKAGRTAREVATNIGQVTRKTVLAVAKSLRHRRPASTADRSSTDTVTHQPPTEPVQQAQASTHADRPNEHGNTSRPEWSRARLDRLENLWRRGFSVEQIAADLGGIELATVVEMAGRMSLGHRSDTGSARESEADLCAKRAALLAQQVALEIKGQKFFQGSRKFIANRQERDRVARQLAAIERALAKFDQTGDV